MKILYIAMKYDYGKMGRGYSFEHYNFYHSLVHMNNKKHEIIYFPFDEIMHKIGKEAMNALLLKKVSEIQPDLCFFFLFTDEITHATIQYITAHSGAITFNWFADDHWRFYTYSQYYAPDFHWVSTTYSQALPLYHRIGYNQVLATQWACNHFFYKPSSAKKKYPVSFVGQSHGDRKQIIQTLKNKGVDITCWGTGWPQGRLTQEAMLDCFSQSKINLNLTNVSTNKNFLRLFFKRNKPYIKPPREILNTFRTFFLSQDQIKGRNFEIPGTRSFLLTNSADNLEDYYIPNKEIVVFTTIPDLLEKINYYLNHDDERIAIAKAAYTRTLRDHTYEKRFNALFRRMKL